MNRTAILLVDDSELDVQLFKRGLESPSLDIELHTVFGGAEALRWLRDPASPAIQAVLLDLKMPGLDGYAVLSAIREDPLLQHLPVIILSSSNQPRDIVECYRLGANGYLQKAMDPALFRETARSACLYWANYNIIPPSPR